MIEITTKEYIMMGLEARNSIDFYTSMHIIKVHFPADSSMYIDKYIVQSISEYEKSEWFIPTSLMHTTNFRRFFDIKILKEFEIEEVQTASQIELIKTWARDDNVRYPEWYSAIA